VNRARRNLDACAVALFVAACAAPAVGALLRPGAAAASVKDEQRKPAQWPALPHSPREAARLPRELKAWHDDHLGWRDVILETRSRLLFHVLGLSPTPTAVIGGDGWLWYASESSMPAWRGAAPLRPSRIEGWVRVFRDRAEWCRAHGAAYVLALAPNKMEVYPERVPPPYEKVGPSRCDQITTALNSGEFGGFVDLRAELLDERRDDTPEDFTYSRRGTHWTSRAAVRGARAMLTRARAAGVDVEIPGRDDFQLVPVPFDDDGWRGQLHLPELEREVQPVIARALKRRWRPNVEITNEPGRIETRTGVETLPRAWVVHDSFGSALRPILAPFFSHAVFDWRIFGQFDTPAMIEFAPALVIDVHTERQVFKHPPDRIASVDESERAARFERSAPDVWRLADVLDGWTADPDLRCSVVDGALELEAGHWGRFVTFQDVDLSLRGTPILHLVVVAENAGGLFVQWPNERHPGWRNPLGEKRELAPGRQELWIEILDPLVRGPIRVSPEIAAGRVRIEAAEIRSAGW
jgi:hypothetical protein